MSETDGEARQSPSQAEVAVIQDAPGASTMEALRTMHAVRARSAADRTTAACRYAGVEADPAVVVAVPEEAAAKAANAIRLSADAIAALAENAPDPAADGRQARNAAAAAVLAAGIAQSHTGGELSDAAYRAALLASQAAGKAAGRDGWGRNAAFNTEADAAEAAAVAAAEAAGWM